MIYLTLFYPGGLSRTSGLYLDRWWLMGHAGLSKYKQSAHNTQGKVIGISLCLHSLVTAGPKDPSAWTVTWMPGVLSAQSGFNQHANNVNKCKREPLKRRSLTSYFFLFSYCYACVYAVMYLYHTIPLYFFFDFECFKFGKTTSCTNCKITMTWTNKFSMSWAQFLI